MGIILVLKCIYMLSFNFANFVDFEQQHAEN